MSDEDMPSIEINMDAEHLTPGPGEHVYVHLDEIEEYEHDFGNTPHVYIFDRGRREEATEAIQDLRNDYILATGVVFPEWVRDEMPLATEVLNGLEWHIALYGRPEPDDLDAIRREVDHAS